MKPMRAVEGKPRIGKGLFAFATVLSAVLLLPTQAEADREHHRGKHRHKIHSPHRHHHGHGPVSIVVRGHRHYYHGGCFYRHGPKGYFWVAAPIGAVIAELPAGHIRLYFGPSRFFYYGGIYYRHVPEGYVVVEKPDTVYVEKQGDG
jgi:hypothetical protein